MNQADFSSDLKHKSHDELVLVLVLEIKDYCDTPKIHFHRLTFRFGSTPLAPAIGALAII